MIRIVLKVTFQGHITSSSDPYTYILSLASQPGLLQFVRVSLVGRGLFSHVCILSRQ